MIRKFFVSVIAIGLLLFLGLGLAEVVLRVLPARYIPGMSSGPRLVKDPDIGYKRQPNSQQAVTSSCYAISEISTNDLGFRGNVWDRSKASIAVLGDSFTEGFQVSDNQTVESVLQDGLPFQIINAGISSFGTVGEREIYNTYLTPLKPKVTILYFLTANDVEDNLCQFRQAGDGTTTKVCATLSDTGELIINKKLYSTTSNSIVNSIISHCKVCQVIWTLTKKISSTPGSYTGAPEGYRSYEIATSTIMEQAWAVTEKTLVTLKQEVERDNGKLLIVTIPDYARVSDNWQQELQATGYTSDYIAQLDPQIPLARLKALAMKDNLDLLTLEESFLAYRDQYKIPAPYFSYRCDGHWNPLGHYLAAQLTSRYLLEHNYLDLATSTTEELLQSIYTNLQQDPKTILGEGGYEAIYNGGVYRH